MPKSEHQYKDRDLLVIAYWWHRGLRSQAPEWVTCHPMWPANNQKFHKGTTNLQGGKLATACPGDDRLWEAIAAEFGVDNSFEKRAT